MRADSKALLPLGLQEAGGAVALGGRVGLTVAVGGLVGWDVAVVGTEVWVAEPGIKDGPGVEDRDQVVERAVVDTVPQKEFVGLLPTVGVSIASPVVVGAPVSVGAVSEGSIEGIGEGVRVTGSGSKGVLEIVGEDDDSVIACITGSGSVWG